VRDIWNRRTWLDATRPLWTDLEIDDHRRENEGKGDRASSPNAKAIIRRPGRPTGAKDSSPRRKGTASHSVSECVCASLRECERVCESVSECD